MKQIKNGFWVLFTVIIFGIGFFTAYYVFGKNDFTPQVITVNTVEEVVNEKLNLETAIIENFQTKKELITLEAELSDIIEWDDSWGTFGVFHKSQRIRFYGTGLYITDLNLVTDEDIQVHTERKTVTIALPKPVIKSITVNEDKTEYESVEKGWLRFGSISLTPEQYNAVYSTVKKNMRQNLESQDFRGKAEKAALTSVKEIFQVIVDSLEDGYTVKIVWRAE